MRAIDQYGGRRVHEGNVSGEVYYDHGRLGLDKSFGASVDANDIMFIQRRMWVEFKAKGGLR